MHVLGVLHHVHERDDLGLDLILDHLAHLFPHATRRVTCVRGDGTQAACHLLLQLVSPRLHGGQLAEQLAALPLGVLQVRRDHVDNVLQQVVVADAGHLLLDAVGSTFCRRWSGELLLHLDLAVCALLEDFVDAGVARGFASEVHSVHASGSFPCSRRRCSRPRAGVPVHAFVFTSLRISS